MHFRLDRFISLYLVAPFFRTSHKQSVPILMYHSVSDRDESNVHPYYRTATAPAFFAAQLKWLQENGYTSCSLPFAISELRKQDGSVTKLVAITFDDGYADFYRCAFPVLQRYGLSATVFVPTAYIGERPKRFKGMECLTWREMQELQRYGIKFGSHTVNHPQLRNLAPTEIQEEITHSKNTIEEKLGTSVDSFAYPYAFPQADKDFKQRLRELLMAAGYDHGVCTVTGRANRASDPLFLERLPINSCDDQALFKAKLAGSYDWISKSQYIFKIVKSRLHSNRGAKYRVSNILPSVQRSSK